MRYLLVIVGLLAVVLGFLAIGTGRPDARPSGELFVQVGAVFLAVGLAAVDIVEAIKAKHP